MRFCGEILCHVIVGTLRMNTILGALPDRRATDAFGQTAPTHSD